ncbi:pyroglutamyl-peptidase 1 [Sitophilus oryzae]|uniref:Pyroglutamyl-peptidase 1 n=1 Tax=Sitophilus oryzae TaxID=7048 RepID=A0A6J2YSP4_SITOR|nr:pyroglutamyl-peptidase 1 [Sitophilus oryzae]
MSVVENILVTGFGPFGEHKENASWEAVSSLPNEIKGFNVVKKQIPVIYTHVEVNIPNLWQEYNPKLVVHVGVSSYTNAIQIETRANKKGYERKDILNVCPTNSQANPCNEESNNDCIETSLCASTICNHLKEALNIQTVISRDAGRYLCEFIYYTSLNIDKKRTLFIHVPPVDKPYTKTELAHALEEIIKCGLELVFKNEENNYSSTAATIYKNGRAAAVF